MSPRLRKAAGSFDRTVPAAVTAERLMRQRARFGVTRVTEATGLDVFGIPVHTAVTPRSISSSTVSAGKGLTPADSLAGALAEAIEVDCAERFSPREVLCGTADALRQRHRVFAPHLGLPGRRRFPHALELEWIWVENLGLPPGERRGLLPRDFVRQGSHGHTAGALFPEQLSNGLASGNVLEEAVAHALEELIERDAEAIFTFRGKHLEHPMHRDYARLDLRTLPERARGLVEQVTAAGRTVKLIDATTDVGIPVVLCEIDGACGAGAHSHAERAVLRAITEAVQTSTIHVQGAREDLERGSRDARVHPGNFGLEVPAVRRLLDDASLVERPFSALPSHGFLFVEEDVQHLLGRLAAVGIRDVYLADLTHPDCDDFHVAKVVVPGLESNRLDNPGPRRLRWAL
ncbi:MAG: YcaO-like family protein [Archangiaceae bacterium]|nr:YcaO-like family protein [Archangiaceae bacterium]